ncbi:hypothetical protein Tco_1080699 [Tanacetum coccineum]|uniref:Uncharacterized protein n=1 Tax=Tanacetum coccineum TaxID=301880 RepID=A0ABQ5HVN7_9ASTR
MVSCNPNKQKQTLPPLFSPPAPITNKPLFPPPAPITTKPLFSPFGNKPPLTKNPFSLKATSNAPAFVSQRRQAQSGGGEASRQKKKLADVQPASLLKENFLSEEAPSTSNGVQLFDEEQMKEMWALFESIEKDVNEYFPLPPNYVPKEMVGWLFILGNCGILREGFEATSSQSRKESSEVVESRTRLISELWELEVSDENGLASILECLTVSCSTFVS